jgi:alpha-beta hydrolase superfamily lysophospholipase
MSEQHIEGYFLGYKKYKLFEQSWLPQQGAAARGIIIIVHGLAEHGGRYAHVADFFTSHGFIVCVSDLRGHGKSDGQDTEFSSMNELIEDLDIFIAKQRKQYPGLPVYLYGHSMGGMIATLYVIKKQPKFNGVLLTGAALAIGDSVPTILVKIVGILGILAPKLKTVVLDGSTVSKDPLVVESYNNDPLNYRGGIPACTAAAFNSGIAEAQANLSKFRLPTLIMHGSEDKLVDVAGSELIYQLADVDDKQLKIYEGLYHELLNEPEQEQVMGDMLAWMEERLD